MIRHYLIAAWRNLAANKLQSAIAIFGLSAGIAAAILMALVVRNQLSFDHFFPGYERTYLVAARLHFGEVPQKLGDSTDPRMADLIRLNAPGVEGVNRLFDRTSAWVKHGQTIVREKIAWADPNMFAVLAFPVAYGDPASALHRPDSVVLSRSVAEKYFGRDDVVGQTISLNDRPMTVRAVIEDFPANASGFSRLIYVSDLSPYSPLVTDGPIAKGRVSFSAHTYLRLKPGASPASIEKAIRPLFQTLTNGDTIDAALMRLDRANVSDDLHPGAIAKLAIYAATGLLILFVAGANFVNLVMARSARREKEVGVRKACGAGRWHLSAQFLGEAMMAVLLAACLAVALCRSLVPPVNAFLQTGMAFDYWRDPLLVFGLLLGVAVVGLAAGAYPAIILSAFRPARILRGWAGDAHTGAIRNTLVMLQFAILIILMIAANVVYLQQAYLAREALRVNIDETLVVKAACPVGFLDGVRALPGVKAAACAGAELLDGVMIMEHDYKGKGLSLDVARAERPLFAQYGLWPVAGFLPSRPDSQEGNAPGLVINMAAVRHMGFTSAKAAIGQPVWQEAPWGDLRIVAVVPDFALNNFENIPIPPTVYTDFGNGFEPPKDGDMIHIRLNGRDIPETLSAIDKLWTATGGEGAASRFFLDAHMQERYVSMLRQAQLFAMFAAIAVFLACLGLAGIAISTAERRTKEIGVRKAMGAENSNIVTLLLWEFSKPVLWANLIAWPVAWWALTRWLSGFAYHVPLDWRLFPAAGAATLLVALLTVAGQAFLVARQKPVLALRYE